MNLPREPLVSVVVPTYNRRDFIGETLASVMAQTYANFELIVIDDGSTDGTREFVLDAFGHDPRLRYISQPNSERAVARNRGIRESRGEFVAFLDSDDLWLPSKLERQVSAMWIDGAPECCFSLFDVLTSDAPNFEPVSLPPQGDIFEPLLNHCFIGSMTPLIQRRCFDVVGGFCEDRRLLCFEDWEMWTRLASAFRWTLVPEILGRYRLHPGNTQHAADLAIDELRMRLMQSYRLSPRHKTSLQNYMTARRWHWATRLYRDEPRVVVRLLMRLAVQNPRRLLFKNFWGLLVRDFSCLLGAIAGKKAASEDLRGYQFSPPKSGSHAVKDRA